MGWIELWTGVLTKPGETYAANKNKGDFSEGMKMIAACSLVYGLLVGIAVFVLASAAGTLFGGVGLGATLGVGGLVVAVIGSVVLGVVGSYVMNHILLFASKLMGGTGEFNKQFYLYAITAAPVMILAGIANLIPVVGMLLAMLVSLYALYLWILMLKEVHGFDLGKAVIALILSAVIIAVIAFVIGLVIAMLGIAYLTPSMTTSGPLPVT